LRKTNTTEGFAMALGLEQQGYGHFLNIIVR